MTKKVNKDKLSRVVIPLRRPYRELVLAFVLFGACAVFFFVRASNNDRGLILNGLIEFGPEGADWFYAIMGLLSAGMAGMGLWGTVRISQIKEFEIVLDRETMTFPAAPLYRAPVVTVPYDCIVSMEMAGAGAQAAVIVRESDRAHTIPSRWIPEGWTAQRIVDEVISRVRFVHGKATGAGAS